MKKRRNKIEVEKCKTEMKREKMTSKRLSRENEREGDPNRLKKIRARRALKPFP